MLRFLSQPSTDSYLCRIGHATNLAERAPVRPILSVIVPVPRPECAVAALASLTHPVGMGRVELLVTIGGCPARQRNAAVAEARSEILYFVDDDTWIAPETLKSMLDRMQALGAAALGGPAVTRAEAGLFERIVGEVMASRLGSGVVRARSAPVGALRPVQGEELVSCNLLMRREWFLRVGGLDEAIYPGEDVDLLKRLREARASMYYDPEAVVERTRRRSVGGLAYQYYRYAQGRGLRFLRHLRPKDLIFLLPTLLLGNLLLIPWLPPHGLLLYALLALAEGVRIGRQLGSAKAALLSAALFPVQHLSYGWGMLVGLLGIEARSTAEFQGVTRHVLEL